MVHFALYCKFIWISLEILCIHNQSFCYPIIVYVHTWIQKIMHIRSFFAIWYHLLWTPLYKKVVWLIYPHVNHDKKGKEMNYMCLPIFVFFRNRIFSNADPLLHPEYSNKRNTPKTWVNRYVVLWCTLLYSDGVWIVFTLQLYVLYCCIHVLWCMYSISFLGQLLFVAIA